MQRPLRTGKLDRTVEERPAFIDCSGGQPVFELGVHAVSSLAWTLKAWLALSLPETGRWKDQRRQEKFRLLKMEFRTFVTAIIRIPCQIVKTGRQRVFRLLNGNDMQPTFWRLVDMLKL